MDKKVTKKQPGIGSLSANAQIELHSVETVRLWGPGKKQSKKPSAPSVGRWLQLVSTLEHAARQDDPYADYALLELERVMDHALMLFHDTMASMPPLQSSRIRFSEAQSSQPLVKELRISSRFGWRLIAVLEAYDVLMCRLFDAQFKAQLTRKEFEHHKNQCQQAMRALLQQVNEHRHSGITRHDVLANNAKAQEAQDKFGAIPLEVLEGLERAQFAPTIKGARG